MTARKDPPVRAHCLDQLNSLVEYTNTTRPAKGVLAQRHGVPMDQAFLILRAAAASAHMSLRDMATKCVTHHVSDNEQAMIS
ncbi:hypothetical protein B7495_10955 [Cryobacterium sp. LW097]|uniref:ANTAR domain-containing protein n=1 Tax=unclassified Cryobacterium TaxID=2649013 RepID=UPI000B4DCEDB|nr:hypothetical protein B7495_10955 [Cryobacterium sp. LW097]TFC51069.1 ANTAR domain-containing protein [Cryobacterium sp. TMB3-1-2]TFC57521.1 ANTAR domain-containing protein [Cryobacterium sp. TMB1-7]TFC74415.1 ANTAR domain-containing protein [Cryobacterium sp. TMB3-15]TFC79928.1 ANTAR domain-containing protein [Cryobacterium sp. TMB3-10]TFC90043.1 ANTAR domain-containing protein [Cryobacterium sp. TMT4-31]TFD41829.1 ANTAR domain-containing protein [Cryobacterium sp. TMB3-12]